MSKRKLKKNKKARVFKKNTYCSDPRRILVGGNMGNGPIYSKQWQGFDLYRGSYEINPFTGQRRYFR